MALVVVVDASPNGWEPAGMEFDHMMQQLLVFMNAHLALDASNSVAMVVASPPRPGVPNSGSRLVYPNHKPGLTPMGSMDTGKLAKLKVMNDTVLAQTKDALASIGPGPTSLAAALTKAFCHLHKERTKLAAAAEVADVPFESRVLVITPATESADDYTSIMNCIFCAQNQGARMDGCVLGGELPLLQQAASLTQGLYTAVPKEAMPQLLQHLLSVHLAGDEMLPVLNLPAVRSVNFEASCLGCNSKIEPFGFVCSECLSMFCAKCRPTKKKPACTNCQAVVVH